MATQKVADCWIRKVTLNGIADLMFDRYAGDNQTVLTPEQKLYYDRDGASLVVPAANLMSFLTAENTESAPRRFLGKKAKGVARAILSYVVVQPNLIPLTRGGKQIKFTGFSGDEDTKAGIYIHRSVARLPKGIPNPKVRPVVRCPWELSFELTMFRNDEVQEETVLNLLQRGGLAIGLGTFRGVYGKFAVKSWE